MRQHFVWLVYFGSFYGLPFILIFALLKLSYCTAEYCSLGILFYNKVNGFRICNIYNFILKLFEVLRQKEANSKKF